MNREMHGKLIIPSRNWKYRRFKLYTNGEIPGIDAMAIMCEVLNEMPEHERRAAINYVVDRFITHPPR